MNVHHEVGEKVIINEPTWTQVGHTLVQGLFIFSRFNLKHKQRPTPSKKKGMFLVKASNEGKAEKYLHNTIAHNQNGISLRKQKHLGVNNRIHLSL